jgi:hypothetical protein
MDQEFASLVLGDLPAPVDSLALRLEDGRCAAVARSPNGPTVFMRDNVLVFAGHLA